LTESHEIRSGVSKTDAILIGCLSHVAVSILDGFFKEYLYKYSPLLFSAFDLFKFVVIPAGVLIWLARRFSITPSGYGLRRAVGNNSWLHFLGLTVLLAVFLNFAYHVAQHFAWVIIRPADTSALYKSVIPDGLFHFPVVLYFGVTAGLVEEIFFRALPLLYVKERFRNRVPLAGYVVTTSVLFAAAHWENGAHEVVATFVYGLFASVLYLKLRDLWPLVGAHALIDIWAFS
jgi:membrane protease YdiL (CAAX protease family)